MRRGQFIKKTSLLTMLSGSIKAADGGNTTLKPQPQADIKNRLQEFLGDSQSTRKKINSWKVDARGQVDREVLIKCKNQIEEHFLDLAEHGNVHAQFFLAKLLWRINLFEKGTEYEKEWRDAYTKWFDRAVAQNHPEAMMCVIKYTPGNMNNNQYIAAIQGGSVSALGAMCYDTSGPMNDKDWKIVGPNVGLFDNWNEAILNWLIIYFYLLRIDPARKRIALKFPPALAIKSVMYPEAETKVPDADALINLVEKAVALSGKIERIYLLEEIYHAAFRDTFNSL